MKMQTTSAVLLACGLVLASGQTLWAQASDAPARYFISVNGAYQAASRTTDEAGSFTLYDEPGSFAGSREVPKSWLLDVGAGVRVWNKLSVGAAYSMTRAASDVPFALTAPHPVFYGRSRTATLQVNDLGHQESAVHFQASYQVLEMWGLRVSAVAGPTLFMVTEDSVASVTVAETGSPYTAVTPGAEFASSSKSAMGFNVGADLSYRVLGGLGVGAFFRYSAGTVTLPSSGGSTKSVKVGGPQAGAGLRYAF